MTEAHWTKTSPGPENAVERHYGGRLQSWARRPHSRHFRAALIVTTALAAMSLDSRAKAQTMWTGAISSDWTVPGNWSAGVPGAADIAVIDVLTPSTVLDAAGFAHSLYVGDAGFGFLSIENGGLLTTTFGTIGSGSDGAIHVTGNTAEWQNSAALSVGTNGNGALVIAAGGTVSSDMGTIGGFVGSHTGSGTVTVSGTGSSWQTTFGLFAGVGSGIGTLIIEDGGTVSSNSGLIGRYSDSNGAITVTGVGSVWTNTGYLAAGYGGAGSLTIEAAGTVSNTFGYIGVEAGSNGTVLVTGTDALWTNSSELSVGVEGSGSLVIEAGGTVSNTNGYMGHLASGVGSALVSGPGALWQNSGVLYVGEYGAGTLNIEDGGEVVNTFGYIGLNPDSSGEVTVSDASWQNASNLYVASGGNGALRVEAGGTVSNVTGFIGFYAGSNGAAAVSNASWHNSHDLYIGREGSGSLSIDDGGAVANVDGLIGFYEGSNGSVAVSGAGTKWQNSGDLFVGQEGTGSLSVADGGTVFNTNGSVGTAPGSVGTATVSGQDASWQNSGYLRIGEHGAGTLTIENGGTVSNTHGYLGLGTSATGIATITGSGSTWINGGSLIVGDFGHGTMNIGDGGTVSNVDGIVGYNSGSLGTVTVSGADTSWQNSGFFFYIGYDSNSTGTLIITDGGTVSNNNSFIGTVSDSIGAVTVSGADAAWQNSGSLNVGHSGTGALTIEDGGTVFNTQGTIGAHTGSSGAVTVSGAGASWQNSASLRVGLVGNGTLTVADGGVVSALAMEVANNDTSTGTLSIGAAAGDAAVAAGAVETDTITFGAGNGALVFNHTAIDYLFDPALSGSGHVNHFAGTTILTGDSAGFSGATTVHAGTLVVNGVLGGTLDVLANGRLEGAGTVGTTKLASGATVAPGNSIGTLDVVGDISFDAGSIYEVEVDPAGSDSDLIHATGTATLNGGSVAHIGLVGAYQPFATYTILTADGGVAGTFDDVASAFAFLDPTLSYDPNNVFLKLVRNDIAFCGVGLTFNQCATGEGAESLGFGHPLHDALVVLDEDTARAAFDRLSGEIQGSVKGAMLEDSRFLREAATTRVRAAFSGVAASPLPVIAYGDGGPAAAPADTDRLAAWGHAFGSWGEWNSDGNAASFDRSIGGFFVGGDGLVAENLRLGLLAGYSRSSFDVDDRSSSGSTSNYHLGIYGGTQLGNFGFRAGAAYSWHDVETFRQVGFPGFSDTLAADYDAATTQGFGELGYRIDTRAASFEPFANLAYVNVHTDGFVETGGAAALSGASSSTDATFTTLGLRASTGFMLGTMNATARGMLGLRHAFGDVTPLSTHAFTGGDAFTVAGVPIAGDAAILEAGFDLVISPNVVLGFSYSGQIASKVDDHGLKADLAVKF